MNLASMFGKFGELLLEEAKAHGPAAIDLAAKMIAAALEKNPELREPPRADRRDEIDTQVDEALGLGKD